MAVGAPAGQVLIVGAGAAGLACADHLRSLREDLPITVLDADADQPYDRPPLSKDVLSGKVKAEEHGARLRSSAAERSIGVIHAAVSAVDAVSRTVVTAEGNVHGYDRLVLAPGCTPINPWRRHAPGLALLHSLKDVVCLQGQLRDGSHVLIIGAGLIGLEVAAVLRTLGHKVTLVEADQRPLARILGAEVGARVQARHVEHDVDFVLGRLVTSVRADGRLHQVTLDDGSVVEGDVVVTAVGVRPATEWLVDGPVQLGSRGEILANEYLQTTAPNIWAAGDATSWPSRLLGGTRRIEHWTCAKEQGRYVAAALAAQQDPGRHPFDTLPYFWSMQYGSMLQAAGSFTANDVVLEELGAPGGGFSARYLVDGQLVGVVASGNPRAFLSMKSELEAASRV